MCYELSLRKIKFERQVHINVIYKNQIIHGQRLDILFDKSVVVEVKSLKNVPEIALAQVLSYLKSANLKRALLINFCERKLIDGVKRISL